MIESLSLYDAGDPDSIFGLFPSKPCPRGYKYGTGPSGWELGMGLTTHPIKNCLLGN